MSKKLIKVYAVEGKYQIHKPYRSRAGKLFDLIYDIDPNIYSWDIVAVFSERKEAERFIKEDVFPYDDEVKGKRVNDWKVDYELYWKEWNKKEEEQNV